MKPLVLCILDGVGISKESKGNAVKLAAMPNFNHLLKEFPNSLLEASGTSVGLPEGQMGNSEVGHTNIGAGRVVYQPLELINQQIKNKEFFINRPILDVIDYTKKNNSKLHIMGLLSDGGIHSHINHLFAILDMCKEQHVKEVYLHLFLDGRDTLPEESLKYLNQLDNKIKELGLGKICTLVGRYYAMDRDNNYDRLFKAYDMLVNGEGTRYDNYEDAIKDNESKGITDEFTLPSIIDEATINNKDGVIVFNFRPDRLREIESSLTSPDFDGFPHKDLDIKLVTMMPVSNEVVCEHAFDLSKITDSFGEYISKKGLTQLRIAETEKYAHVTYFFDGGVEQTFKGEKRTLIPSPKVATYDLKPEMSAVKITDTLLKQLPKFDVVILNFANGDMVGHTGDMEATIKALEIIDKCIGRIYSKISSLDGTLVITADHGNADYMIDANGNKVTSHSTAKVPFIITKKDIKLENGKLADIAPTLLTLLDLPIPSSMNGKVLIKKNHLKKKCPLCEKIFRFISIVFICLFIDIYGYRTVHFYKESHTKENYVETNIISKLDSYTVKTHGSGLYECENVKCFKGLVDNNYLYYKGILWRIVSYNSDEVKLVSEESLTTLMINYNNTDYLAKWISNFKEQLNDTSYIKDISLLSSDEYTKTQLGDSYLNNNTYWWTNDNKYININGDVNDYSGNSYGIRPTITLSKDAIIISGSGSITNPYQIVNDSPFSINDASIGTYITYSDHLWRVVSRDETGVKVALEDLLDEQVYSNNKGSFNIYEKDTVGYYLNNTFYNSLDKTYIKKGKWNIISYNETNKYNYMKISKTINCYVGLLNVGDLFINDNNNYDLMTENDSETSYKLNPYGLLYVELKTTSHKVRPAIYLDGSLVITKGSGYRNSPYSIGE